MTDKAVYLYAIGDERDKFRVTSFQFIPKDELSITELRYTGIMMLAKDGNAKEVWAIDNRKFLRKDLEKARKQNSIESWAVFKDLLTRYGVLVAKDE